MIRIKLLVGKLVLRDTNCEISFFFLVFTLVGETDFSAHKCSSNRTLMRTLLFYGTR